MMSVEVRILAATLARLSARSIEERLNAHSPDREISGLQYGVLRTLSRQSYTLSELSRRFLLDPSTLVPVIHALERKGLVERGRDPEDRRRWSISLTPEGSALSENLPFFHEDDLLYQCLIDLGQDKSRALLDLLRDVIRRMPDGEKMLGETHARLSIMKTNEVGFHEHDCNAPSDKTADHQNPVKRRNRGQYRRRRNQE